LGLVSVLSARKSCEVRPGVIWGWNSSKRQKNICVLPLNKAGKGRRSGAEQKDRAGREKGVSTHLGVPFRRGEKGQAVLTDEE